jgi:putative membrane protein
MVSEATGTRPSPAEYCYRASPGEAGYSPLVSGPRTTAPPVAAPPVTAPPVAALLVAALLVAAGILTQLCYPLTSGPARDVATVTTVTLLAAGCAVHAVGAYGARWAAGLIAITALGGLAVEMLGTGTGVPFGDYSYAAARLGPAIPAHGVPLLIGAAWLMGAYPAWCAAGCLIGDGPRRVPVAAAGLAGWDLYLDPQLVGDGQWRWQDPHPALPGVPGVPVGNYLGWLLVALLMATGLQLLSRSLRSGGSRGAGGSRRADGLPVLLYCWTWLGSGVAQLLFLGLPASAGYGLVGMGTLGVPLLVRAVRARRHPPVRQDSTDSPQGSAPAHPELAR